jgi:hypothetical protein
MGDADKLTRYQKQMKGKQGQGSVRLQGQLEKKVGGTRERGERTEMRLNGDKIDSIFGFDRMKEVRLDFIFGVSFFLITYHKIIYFIRGSLVLAGC